MMAFAGESKTPRVRLVGSRARRRAAAGRARAWPIPVLTALLAMTVGRSAEPAPEQAATDDDLRIQGIFNSALPRTERKNSLRLIVHPHLGDFTKYDEIRTELGLRYGISRHWEVLGEFAWYFSHGLKHVPAFSEFGWSRMHFGTKYLLGDPLKLGWETSVGVDYYSVIDHPPVGLTDGLRHLTPYATFSRQLVGHPAWRVFFGTSFDDVSRTSIPARLDKNDLGGDALGLSGGFIVNRGRLAYTFEASYKTMHFLSDTARETYAIRPGIIWVIPEKYTFGTHGRWLLGTALAMEYGPDGFDAGLGVKLRANFDFKRLIGRRSRTAPGQ